MHGLFSSFLCGKQKFEVILIQRKAFLKFHEEKVKFRCSVLRSGLPRGLRVFLAGGRDARPGGGAVLHPAGGPESDALPRRAGRQGRSTGRQH